MIDDCRRPCLAALAGASRKRPGSGVTDHDEFGESLFPSIESERRLSLLVLTRFLDANRSPLRLNTLWWLTI